MPVAAGVDLGGTAINFTFIDDGERFLIEELFEHPALSREGPETCLGQITAGLEIACRRAGIGLSDVAIVGLDTPGPASSTGVLSARGSTNFVHPEWAGFDIRGQLERRVGRPVVYVTVGKGAALWVHVSVFGAKSRETSVSAIIGTGLGGGVIVDGRVVTGRKGFGGELGHVLVPYQRIPDVHGLTPQCNCGRIGDLESLCSLTAIERTLLPMFLAQNPEHPLARVESIRKAATMVRNLAAAGDEMCRAVFKVQARALGLFFDEMINTFDP